MQRSTYCSGLTRALWPERDGSVFFRTTGHTELMALAAKLLIVASLLTPNGHRATCTLIMRSRLTREVAASYESVIVRPFSFRLVRSRISTSSRTRLVVGNVFRSVLVDLGDRQYTPTECSAHSSSELWTGTISRYSARVSCVNA
jgi:hypothetical protein